MKIIIKENIKENEQKYLIKFKCELNDCKRYFNVVVNEKERDIILNDKSGYYRDIKKIKLLSDKEYNEIRKESEL